MRPLSVLPRRRGSVLPALALGLLVAGSGAWAQKSPAVDRVSVWLGGYRVDANGDLQAHTPDGAYNTGWQRVIDGDETVYRARLDWLLFESQGFSIDYYRFKRTDTRGISDSFSFNGVNYAVDASASAKTTVDVGNFSYRWWFGSGDTALGLGLGAAYFKASLAYEASATLGGVSDSVVDRVGDNTWAPLVTFGLRHRINDAFRVYADVSGARKNGGDNSGDIVNAALGVEYFPWQNIGVGAEYGTTRIRYHHRGDDVDARLKLRLNGPSVFLRMRF